VADFEFLFGEYFYLEHIYPISLIFWRALERLGAKGSMERIRREILSSNVGEWIKRAEDLGILPKNFQKWFKFSSRFSSSFLYSTLTAKDSKTIFAAFLPERSIPPKVGPILLSPKVSATAIPATTNPG
jgi:hypothetical protein